MTLLPQAGFSRCGPTLSSPIRIHKIKGREKAVKSSALVNQLLRGYYKKEKPIFDWFPEAN
jgi:hypothetical protein